MLQFLLLTSLLLFNSIFIFNKTSKIPSGKTTYKRLNLDRKKPFVVSFGTSISQTDFNLPNTVNPKWIAQQLHSLTKKQVKQFEWLKEPNRIWYLLRSLPNISCSSCLKNLNTNDLDPLTDEKIIDSLIKNLIENINETQFIITMCPYCLSKDIKTTQKSYPHFTNDHKKCCLNKWNI